MSNFVNTVDMIDDDVLIDSLIEKSFSGSFNDDKITAIGSGVFAYCTNLESVCFPNVKSIYAEAFTGSGLKTITPETFPLVTKIDYLYGGKIFAYSALETVDWPSLERFDDSNLFAGCTSLKSVSLPNLSFARSHIGLSFSGCVSLTDVNLPLLATGCTAFSGCTSLKTLTLPLVQQVYGESYTNCTSLQLIDLPSCTQISGSNNFSNCSKLKALILRSTTICTLSNTNNFSTNSGIANGTGYIYVPTALLDSYKTAANWSTYAAQFRALEDYTVDGTTTGAMREHCESFALNVTELTFTDANSYTLTPTGQLGILDEITWTTSDKTVARVKNGVVTPIGDGTAIITVTCGEHTATCAVTVNAGIEYTNILDNVGFNTGYLNNSGVATANSSADTYTDKFDISSYVGESIEVQLIDVRNTASDSRICYYDVSNVCVGYTQAAAANYGAVITSTVPDNAEYAAISVNKSGGFSAIDIYCDDVKIGYIEYTS